MPPTVLMALLPPESVNELEEVIPSAFTTLVTTGMDDTLTAIAAGHDLIAAVVGAVECAGPAAQVLSTLRSHAPSTFTIALLAKRDLMARVRLRAFAAGAHMVSDGHVASVGAALGRTAAILACTGSYACPVCGLANLSEYGLRAHFELAHAAEDTGRLPCPVCGAAGRTPLAVHLHNSHGPLELREPPFPAYPAFAWAVVRRRSDGRFLLVHEPAGIARGAPRYWLPAGRVDAGETLCQAARRECIEEAGVRVVPQAVLRLQVDCATPSPRVMRVALLCEPEDDNAALPKAIPD